MRFIQADWIFTLSGKPVKNGIVAVKESGEIQEVFSEENFFGDEKVEKLNGSICPGFVNAHCHLELSHMKGKVAEKTTLPGFITALQSLRKAEEEEIQLAIEKADNEMWENGIVAVGDICNSDDTIQQKTKSKIYYHSFIEVFGFNPNVADEVFNRALTLSEKLGSLSNSIVPHAPYSVSKELFLKIKEHSINHTKTLTIHNQETASENDLFKNKKGAMAEMLQQFKLDLSAWEHSGLNSLPSIINYFPQENPLILVHNTYTIEADIDVATSKHKNLFWCLCPNANLYIENKLPDVNLFRKNNLKILIGTDSLASNYQLSIWEEIKTLQKYFQDIELNELLTWACKNGAEALQLNQFGTIEKGKCPGLNLINPQGDIVKIL
jgi:cytosine/adenosine deaminase-related metal-dependent hydrolase